MNPGLVLLKRFEGYAVALPDGSCRAYWDALGGVWTIGYGSTGADIRRGTVWPAERAQTWLMNRWNRNCAVILRASPILSAHPNRLAAVGCFAYNVGVGAYQTSTLRRYVNEGRWEAAAREFPKWNKSGGRVVAGLTRRRLAEMQLFMTPYAATSSPVEELAAV